MNKCKIFKEDCYQHPKCLATLVDKYGDAHGYKGVGYDWSKEWTEYVRTYVARYAPNLEEWKILSISGNLEQVVIHNKNKFKEPFCQRQQYGINPLRKRVYKRLEKMNLRDLADKCNEIVEKLNKLLKD